MMITQERLNEIEQELLKIQLELNEAIVTDNNSKQFGITLFQRDSVNSISRARQHIGKLSELL
ncbi:hypothetical protein FDG95_gp488 [Pectobacterium phage vB_PcaM_CBB]|uniref:Uncharacterized protein n=1 Tax=Pectobacterium phage vB_PcaM_CBB TaxID=2772511 RepID=A0A1L2CVK6_9CAUD|nr:hypothetical protein FDG95_gp488 [Pectobacterium phage vB_PcaM_CBB]AMM44054.1 hypothetical protein CBB_491 [Pectobacterium phage vB_PcaM_CBB]